MDPALFSFRAIVKPSKHHELRDAQRWGRPVAPVAAATIATSPLPHNNPTSRFPKADDTIQQAFMYLVPDDTLPPSNESHESTSTNVHPAKVTARMLRIRELIELGEYPDRDELAERIVEKL